MLAHSPRIITENLVLLLDAANPRNFNLTAVEVLVVAGGGGGGGSTAGGGGAGGLIYNSNFAVTPGTQLTATVGDGGAGTVRSDQGAPTNTSGGNSVFGALTAIGGGRGYSGSDTYTPRTSAVGGSGGGGGYYGGGLDPKGSGTSSAGTAGQGFAGGDGAAIGEWGGGGGGGAGGAGGAQVSDSSLRIGGPGLGFNISGTLQYYAGGGGGGACANGFSLGGIGGGGNGGDGAYYTPTAGATNTGGGGGGGGYYQYGPGGGAGGSGIIIVRYPGPQKAIGGTITSVGGDTIHTFTTSGNFTPLVNTNGSAVLGLSDLSGNRNFGTSANGPTYSTANGGSLSFDGSNDYVTLTGTESFNFGTGDFTIECWVYFNNINTQQLFISKYSAWGNDADFFLRLTLGGINKIRVYYSPFTFIAESSVIAPSTWYHICVSRISNATTFYTNGSSTGTHTGSISITNNKNTLRLGLSDDNDEPLNGRISNFRVYKGKGLTAAEISQNYNALKSRYI